MNIKTVERKKQSEFRIISKHFLELDSHYQNYHFHELLKIFNQDDEP